MNRRALLVSAAKPTWSWNFAARQAAPPGASFSRTSTATWFDGAGVLRAAGSNVARFEHDPLTHAPLGYLTEMQSTNAITNSRNLAAASWGGSSNITRTANAVVGPDGAPSASTITEDTANARHECDTVAEISVVAGAVYGVSFSVKQVVGSRFIAASLGGVPKLVTVNPATGSVGTIGPNVSGVTSRQLPNGWWRIGLLLTAPVTASGTGIYFSMQRTDTGNSTETYIGDGTSTVAITDVQFETAGVGVTSVIPTAGSTATRVQDVLTMPLTALPGGTPSQGGVLVAAYRLDTIPPASSSLRQIAGLLSDGTTTGNVVGLSANYVPGPFADCFTYSAGFPIINLHNAGPPAVFTRRKHAFGWSVARAQLAYDGVLDAISNGGAPPAGMTTLDIGRYGNQALGGTLESIAYYAGPRSDAFVQQVSR
jgi:hypothetical protein